MDLKILLCSRVGESSQIWYLRIFLYQLQFGNILRIFRWCKLEKTLHNIRKNRYTLEGGNAYSYDSAKLVNKDSVGYFGESVQTTIDETFNVQLEVIPTFNIMDLLIQNLWLLIIVMLVISLAGATLYYQRATSKTDDIDSDEELYQNKEL